MRVGEIENPPGSSNAATVCAHATDRAANRSCPGHIGDIEATSDGLTRGINIGADEFGSEVGRLGQPPRLVDRDRREIEPGGDRAMARQDQRVEAEMALQVDNPLAGDHAELAIFDRVQRLLSGEKRSTA